MATGLGDEQVWSCPSLDSTVLDLAGNFTPTSSGTYSVINDTSNGGSKAYEFPSTYGAINYGRPSVIATTTAPLSISVWVNPYSSNNYRTIWGGYHSTAADNLHSLLRIDNGVLRYFTLNANGNYVYFNGPTLSANTWYHIVLTIDTNGSAEIHLNGTLDTQHTFSSFGLTRTISSSVNYNIGSKSSSTNSSESFYGLIDDFRWFDRILGSSEISHLSTSRGIEGSPYDYNGLGDEKLWLCPSLDDSSDDISGNGNHGTYQGNATTAADTSNGGVKAYYFATGGDCITHDQFGGPLSESQTVTWWSKHNSTGSRVHQVSCTVHEPDGYIGGSNNRWLYEVFNNTTERFWPNGSGSNYNVTRSTANTWRHNCWVRNDGSGDSLFYVDGVLDTTVSQPSIYDASTNISNLLVGLAAGNPTVDLYIDDVRTFDRALTTTEITALASKRGYQVPQGTGPFPHPLTISIKHPLG